MPREIDRCRICQSTNLVSLVHLGDLHLTGVFPATREETITRGPLELVKCQGEGSCGLVQLRNSYDAGEMYGANYGYRSSLNRSMRDHLQEKVRKLTAIASPQHGDLVLDIGSNDGTLLSFYAQSLTTVGMDPTAAKFREFYADHIEVIPDFFSASLLRARMGGRRAKIVTSIAMFYDLDEPIRFVEDVVEILAEDGIWHLEQSYMPTMLALNAYDTICHEHVEYYAFKQIHWMMQKCGLKVIDLEFNDVNGGSFAVTVARESSNFPEATTAINAVLGTETRQQFDTTRPFDEFRERIFRHRDDLSRLLRDSARQGVKTLGYGASTKGNVLLQFCEITPAELPAIAEVNSDKFGRLTPGTHIPIISEEEAHAMKPDCLLVMPWHFRANLIAREAAFLQQGGRLIFPLPTIESVQA